MALIKTEALWKAFNVYHSRSQCRALFRQYGRMGLYFSLYIGLYTGVDYRVFGLYTEVDYRVFDLYTRVDY